MKNKDLCEKEENKIDNNYQQTDLIYMHINRRYELKKKILYRCTIIFQRHALSLLREVLFLLESNEGLLKVRKEI